LRRRLLEQVAHQIPVVDRVFVPGRQGQRLLVGLERFGVASLARQGVAAVVVAEGIVALGEDFCGAPIVFAAVQRAAAPARILGQPGGTLGLARLQRTAGLLVRAQPQILPFQRPHRLRRQQQGEGEHGDHAAPEQRGGQRQDRQQQPGAALAPLLGQQLAGHGATRFAARLDGIEQGVHIAVIRGQGAILPAAVGGELAQRGRIQAGQHHLPGGVAHEAASARDRCALTGTDTEHEQAHRGLRQAPAQLAPFRLGRLVGDEQHVAAAHPAAAQQLQRLVQGQIRAAARGRHQLGAERRQLSGDGLRIVGQRGDGEGRAGVDHQGGDAAAAALEHVGDLEAGPCQAARLEIAGIHGTGQIQGDDQRRGIPVHRLGQALPRRSGQRQHGQGRGERGDAHRIGEGVGAAARHQHVRTQRRITDRGPAAARQPPPRGDPGQQRHRRQRGQPPGSQEMELGRDHACRRAGHRPVATVAASARAAASGHGYSSRRGRNWRASWATGSMASSKV